MKFPGMTYVITTNLNRCCGGQQLVHWYRYGVRLHGLRCRVSGSGTRRSGILCPRRRRQDTRGPGWLTDPAIRVLLLRWRRRQGRRIIHDCGRRARMAWSLWLDRGHFQVPSRVQQRPDSQRTCSRHETVHLVSWDDGRACVHELQDATHVLVPEVLQDDRDAVLRSRMAEKQRLQRKRDDNLR